LMEDAGRLAGQLAEALASSRDYKRYLLYKEQILRDQALYERIKAYKLALADYEKRLASGNLPGLDEEKTLSRQYADLMLDECARSFLAYEEKVLAELRQIYAVIGEACGLEMFSDRLIAHFGMSGAPSGSKCS